MSAHDLVNAFLDHFAHKSYRIVPSASLIPAGDPTLLFTNAGMVPFKHYFVDPKTAPHPKLVSCQKCMRAGGKHNDLEQVGHTTRHHTFFEMLGHFSFGHISKEEAIVESWQWLTEVISLDADRLWVSVFEQDQSSKQIWQQVIGLPDRRIIELGKADNFWSMGDEGPCGPCTEIYYQHDRTSLDDIDLTDGSRFVEIWNLVFTQFDQQGGQMVPLPELCLDTGMGLERLLAACEGVNDNYQTSLFLPLIHAIQKQLHCHDQPLHRGWSAIADHLRAVTFLLADGLWFSNEGRGYVLRRILRRALRFCHLLTGKTDLVLYRLIPQVVDLMKDRYPILLAKQQHIMDMVSEEEKQFLRTLGQGVRLFQQQLSSWNKQVPGEAVFSLYDTYGFPADLTEQMAAEHSLTVDWVGYQACLQQQRERSQQNMTFKQRHFAIPEAISETVYLGDHLSHCEAKLVAVLPGYEEWGCFLLFEQTVFYAEGGGQVADQGWVSDSDGHTYPINQVVRQGSYWLHGCSAWSDSFKVGHVLHLEIDQEHRQSVAANHSATHLLHAALRHVLGPHVQQRGSLVDVDFLRFDFAHSESLTTLQINQIEQWVFSKIVANIPGTVKCMPYRDAIKQGALAFFDEKYGEEVRVLSFGDDSIELCGGTHVRFTGEIGLCLIESQSAVAAGVRRIVARTGQIAWQKIQQQRDLMRQLMQLLHASDQQLVDKVQVLVDEHKQQNKQLSVYRQEEHARKWKRDAKHHQVMLTATSAVLMVCSDDQWSAYLPLTVEQLCDAVPLVFLLYPKATDTAILIAYHGQLKSSHVSAKNMLQSLLQFFPGKGGGKLSRAQGVCHQVLTRDMVIDWLKKYLANTS